MDRKGIPISAFNFYNKKNQEKKKNEEQLFKKDKKAALDLLARNARKLTECNDESLIGTSSKQPDSTNVFDNEVIPATQSPVKKRKSLFFTSPDQGNLSNRFESRLLNKIRKEDFTSVNVSMLSSPSIMNSVRTESPNRLISLANLPQQQTAEVIEVEKVFDELKRNQDCEIQQKPEFEIIDELQKCQPKQMLDDFNANTSSDNQKSVDEVSVDLPPIKSVTPERDWAKINADALRHLKDSSISFKAILDEMKKANEKIIEFRRAIAEDF